LDSLRRKPAVQLNRELMKEENHRWQSGQIPKNSSLWVTALKPFWAAMRDSIFSGKHSSISTTSAHWCRPDDGDGRRRLLADQFKPRRPVAKIKPLHHAHFLQQMHGAVNRGQVAPAPGMAAKISRLVSGCGCRRKISRMAARGPVILRDWPRSRPVRVDISCRGREWECACGFMAVQKIPRMEIGEKQADGRRVTRET
jgi:hypothetical protein